jgi:hypothetical protein
MRRFISPCGAAGCALIARIAKHCRDCRSVCVSPRRAHRDDFLRHCRPLERLNAGSPCPRVHFGALPVRFGAYARAVRRIRQIAACHEIRARRIRAPGAPGGRDVTAASRALPPGVGVFSGDVCAAGHVSANRMPLNQY